MNVEKQKEFLKRLLEMDNIENVNKELIDVILEEQLNYVPKGKLYKFRTCSNQNFNILAENSIWIPNADTFKDVFDCTVNLNLKKKVSQMIDWLQNDFISFLCEAINNELDKNGITEKINENEFKLCYEKCFTSNGERDTKKEYEFYKRYLPAENCDIEFAKRQEQLSEVNNSVKEIVASMLEKAIEELMKLQTTLRGSLSIYCMTESLDNHNLWEVYADDYTGFCIEYSFENIFNKKLDEYKNLIYLFPMIYRKRIPDFDWTPIIKKLIVEKLLKKEYEEIKDTLLALNMYIFYKNKDYESEREWRMVIARSEKNNYFFPFVNAIYAGKDIKKSNLQRLKKIAKKLNVPLYIQTINKMNNGYVYITVE